MQFGSPNIPKLAQCVAVVAVLQFQKRLYDSQKLTLYLYINIEVFLGYGNSLKRTATLQHCNDNFYRHENKSQKKCKISCEAFVNRNHFFLPLQCQNEEAATRALRTEIVNVKSRNCAHKQ